MQTFPDATEQATAVEVEVAEVSTNTSQEISELAAAVIELAQDTKAMNLLVAALFANKEFRSGLTRAFVGIYDTFNTMYTSALSDFSKTFELKIHSTIPEDMQFFAARWLDENDVELTQRAPDGSFVRFDEPNPAVIPNIIHQLKEQGASPSAEIVHYVTLSTRKGDEPAAPSISAEELLHIQH